MSGYAVVSLRQTKVYLAIRVLFGTIVAGEHGILWRKPLIGILAIGIAVALFSTGVGVWALDLSFWGGLLLYSISGTAATLFVAWRRARCLDHHGMQPGRG